MRELAINEINSVSGGSILTPIGEIIIDSVKLTNDILNTYLVSSVGKAFDAIGLGSIHYAADSIAFAFFSLVAAIGSFLGGDASRIDFHFNEEWGG